MYKRMITAVRPVARIAMIHMTAIMFLGGTAACSRPPAKDASLPGDLSDLSHLSHLPNTWYCLSPGSTDVMAERQGILFFAWRLFIAVNWPGDWRDPHAAWVPAATIDELDHARYPRWASWPSPQTMRVALKACTVDTLHPPHTWADNPSSLALEDPDVFASEAHPMSQGNMATASGPSCVYDQRGNLVEYEIRMSPEGWGSNVFDIACKNKKPSPISLGYGQCRGQGPKGDPDEYDHFGAVAVKLAWKVLTAEEIHGGRYLQRQARVHEACAASAKTIERTVGLVGFHITQKTHHYGDWIWSTFEHVDNLSPAPGATTASFHDPRCTSCVDNTSQRLAPDGRCRTQITRVHQIPDDVRAINERFRALLAEKSALQYYELIGVQYKRASNSTMSSLELSEAVLRNSVIETYLVPRTGDNPVPDSCANIPKAGVSSCLGCHKRGADLSFVPRVELCNCTDAQRWVGAAQCRKLGLDSCPGGGPRHLP